jgi:hypothetical protein
MCNYTKIDLKKTACIAGCLDSTWFTILVKIVLAILFLKEYYK